MPIYELVCPECCAKKEVICKFSELFGRSKCPMCESIMIIKPSKAGFTINGYSYSNGYNGESKQLDDTYTGAQASWDD
jgi:predicted nucleic acid-binding Zn ribbon protein